MTTLNVPFEPRQNQSICAQKNSVSTLNLRPSTCQHCRFYKPEGRRGGHCQQMETFVRGSWRSCALALPPFAPSWEGVDPLGYGSQKR